MRSAELPPVRAGWLVGRAALAGAVAAVPLVARGQNAGYFSLTGGMNSPADFVDFRVTGSPGNYTFSTHSWGGGTNAAGDVLPGGGFDPTLRLTDDTDPPNTYFNDDRAPGQYDSLLALNLNQYATAHAYTLRLGRLGAAGSTAWAVDLVGPGGVRLTDLSSSGGAFAGTLTVGGTGTGSGIVRPSANNAAFLVGLTLLKVDARGTVDLTTAPSQTINNAWVDGSVNLGSGTGALSLISLAGGTGVVNLGDGKLVISTGTYSGRIFGNTGTLTKVGTGTLRLEGSAANTFAGPVVVNQGTLELARSSFDAAITGSGMTINGGTVRIALPHQFGNATPVTINGGTLEDLGSDTIGPLTINAPAAGAEPPMITGTGLLTANGLLALNGGVVEGSYYLQASRGLRLGDPASAAVGAATLRQRVLMLTTGETATVGSPAGFALTMENRGTLRIEPGATFNIDRPLRFDGVGTGAGTNYVTAGTLLNYGTIAVGAAGSLTFGDTIAPGTPTGGSLARTVSFNNHGTFTKNDAGETRFGQGFVNYSSGTMNLNAGTTILAFLDTGNRNDGRIAVSAGASLVIHTIPGIDGPSLTTSATSVITGAGDVHFERPANFLLTGTPVFTINGTYNVSGKTYFNKAAKVVFNGPATFGELIVTDSFEDVDLSTNGAAPTTIGTLRVMEAGRGYFARSPVTAQTTYLTDGGSVTSFNQVTFGSGGVVMTAGAGNVMDGAASVQIVARSETTTGAAGRVSLGGNLSLVRTAAGVATGGGRIGSRKPDEVFQVGALDLLNAQRTFNIQGSPAGIDPLALVIDARMTNGGVQKEGGGLLVLSGNSDYAGGTTVAAGTVRATLATALGGAASAVTLSGGNLELRTNDPAGMVLPNALVVSGDAALSVDPLDGVTPVPAAGRAGFASATLGAAALTINGNLRDFEVRGQTTLTGNASIVNAIPVTLSGAVAPSGGNRNLTKAGSAALRLAGNTPNTYGGLTRVNAGTLELAKTGLAVAVPGNLEVFGGATARLLVANQVTNGAAVTVNGAGSVFDLNSFPEAVGTLSVSNSAEVRLGVSASALAPAVLVTSGLTISPSGRVDLFNAAMVVDYVVGPSPLAQVAGYVRAGFVPGGGPHWGGTGIASTTAKTGTNAAEFAIGYAEASAVLGGSGGTWLGQPVDGTAVLVRYTRVGDATLDGRVDFADLVVVAQNYELAQAGVGWNTGDFNFDSAVDFADLVEVAQGYETGLAAGVPEGASAGFAADWGRARGAVPEPGGWAAVVAGTMWAMRRGRRGVRRGVRNAEC